MNLFLLWMLYFLLRFKYRDDHFFISLERDNITGGDEYFNNNMFKPPKSIYWYFLYYLNNLYNYLIPSWLISNFLCLLPVTWLRNTIVILSGYRQHRVKNLLRSFFRYPKMIPNGISLDKYQVLIQQIYVEQLKWFQVIL